uniref:ABC-three component systems C-terminal domain-containing protein n=1 Tax=Muribaculaceae bacterium Z82 TaxID=2304548 RepID=A0A7C9NU43_9BACT
MDMPFATFIKSIYKAIGEGMSRAQFTQNAFAAMSAYEDAEQNPAYDYEMRTFRNYWGGSSIRVLASRMLHHTSPERFADYLEHRLTDSSRRLLFDELSPYCDRMSNENVAESCAWLFDRIIEAAAIPSKEKAFEYPCENPAFLPEDVALLQEAGSLCPRCGKEPLVKGRGRKVTPNYVKTPVIPPHARSRNILDGIKRVTSWVPEEGSRDDYILLCPSCSREYLRNCSTSDVSNLVSIKRSLIEAENSRWLANQHDLQEGIVELLFSLVGSNLDEASSSEELRIEAHAVRDKIQRGNAFLRNTTESYVTSYYGFIREEFRNLEKAGLLHWETVAGQFKSYSQTLEDSGMPQNDVVDALCDWIALKTGYNDSRFACYALVAFFIQDCEVFHAAS